jgi:hypothetical protein
MSKIETNAFGQDLRQFNGHTRCLMCIGSGRMMGGGMLEQDCDGCHGRGFTSKDVNFDMASKDIKIDKNSKHYKKAIKNIKALSDKITDKEAEEIFEKEFKKLD